MDTEDTVLALLAINGRWPGQPRVYRQLGRRGQGLRGLVEVPQPGTPQTNARAERCNQDVLD
eukprot:8432923-Lingulodinium_polyedra.AAC.1